MSDARRIAAAEALEAFKAATTLRKRAKIVAYPLNGEPVDVTEEIVSVLDMITSSMDWGSDFWSDDDLPAFITLCGLLNFAEMPNEIDYSQLPPKGRNLPMSMLPNSREYRLLGMLQEHAPDGESQQKCTDFAHRMQRDGASSSDMEIALASALVDGLRYGNWPWTFPPNPRVRKIKIARSTRL